MGLLIRLHIRNNCDKLSNCFTKYFFFAKFFKNIIGINSAIIATQDKFYDQYWYFHTNRISSYLRIELKEKTWNVPKRLSYSRSRNTLKSVLFPSKLLYNVNIWINWFLFFFFKKSSVQNVICNKFHDKFY